MKKGSKPKESPDLSLQDIALMRPAIIKVVRKRVPSAFREEVEELVDETVLNLLERHSRNTEVKAYWPWQAIQFALGDSLRKIRGCGANGEFISRASKPMQSDPTEYINNLAVPSDVSVRLEQRSQEIEEMEEDDVKEAMEAMRNEPLADRLKRHLDTCLALQTSPNKVPLYRRGARSKGKAG
jgi:hypothetical protein